MMKVITKDCIGLEYERLKQNTPDSPKMGVKYQIIHIGVSVKGSVHIQNGRIVIKKIVKKKILSTSIKHIVKAYVKCNM